MIDEMKIKPRVFIAGLKQDDEESETHNMSEVCLCWAQASFVQSNLDDIQLQDASHSARNDDVAKTNSCISDYIIEQKEYFKFYDYKDFLLYPMCLLDHMRQEEMVYASNKSEWPAFLYPIERSYHSTAFNHWLPLVTSGDHWPTTGLLKPVVDQWLLWV
ncbi:hypothetical protein BJ912DRAFT_934194 [Pholiota molesta]|nr:hypothetical protein BJ912DRAFT_934194 [Pholiota molesta]